MSTKTHEMRNVLETITPERARELLARSARNRKISLSWVKLLAMIIVEGRWEVSHQGIALDARGFLIDGQHRLMAIIEADRAVEMYVAYGMPRRSMLVIDSGARRTDLAAFRIAGHDEITSPFISCARMMIPGAETALSGRHRGASIDRQTLLAFIRQHSDAIAFALENLGKSGLGSAAVLAVIARAYYTVNHAKLKRFCEILEDGYIRDETESAAARLREVLLRMYGRHGDRQGRITRYQKTQRALEAFVDGEELGREFKGTRGLRFLLPGEEVAEEDGNGNGHANGHAKNGHTNGRRKGNRK